MNTTLPQWIRDPRYTGENRCLPCTGVNLVIAAGVSLVVATVSLGWAIVVFALSVATIGVRGYLVPGTPTLTKRYLPDHVLALFDKGPAHATDFAVGTNGAADEGVEPPADPGTMLLSAGALRDEPAVDDYVLEESFHESWVEESRRIADGDEDAAELAAFLDVEPELVALTDRGYAYVATIEGERAGRWESRAAFVADMAAAGILAERWDEWRTLPTATRSELLGSLRIFLEDCPTCDGSVTLEPTVVESCCMEYEVLAATCDDCGTRLFEAPVGEEMREHLAESAA